MKPILQEHGWTSQGAVKSLFAAGLTNNNPGIKHTKTPAAIRAKSCPTVVGLNVSPKAFTPGIFDHEHIYNPAKATPMAEKRLNPTTVLRALSSLLKTL